MSQTSSGLRSAPQAVQTAASTARTDGSAHCLLRCGSPGRAFRFCLALAAAFPFLGIWGCSTAQKYGDHGALYSQGRYKESIAPFESGLAKRRTGSRDFALDDMELGAGYRALQEFEPSNEAFQRAEQGIREQQLASMAGQTAGQVAAVFANDNALPYLVQEYDGIMVNTYKAMNLLQQGKIDLARVEFNRVAERQRMSAVRFQNQIAKAKEEERKENARKPPPRRSSSANGPPDIQAMISEHFDECRNAVTGAMRDSRTRGGIDSFRNRFSAGRWGAMEAFTNPFSSYMHGIFLFVFGEDRSDREAAIHWFKKAGGQLSPAPRDTVSKALALAEGDAARRLSADLKRQIVFVVFENGMGPVKTEYRLPLVLPLQLGEGTQILETSLVLPDLVERSGAFPYLSIRSNGRELAQTSVVCSMDAVVAAEYRERFTWILERNILQCAVKDALQLVIAWELERRGIPRLLSSSLMAVCFGATKHADTRIWASLPKDFQSAVVKRPASGRLQLCPPGAPVPFATVELPEWGPSIVFVHTPAASVPPTVGVVSARAPSTKGMP